MAAESGERQSAPRNWQQLGYNVLPFIIILGGGELVVRSGLIPPLFLPAPSSVLVRLVKIALNGRLIYEFKWTLYRLLIGFPVGAIVGTGLGILMSQSERLRWIIMPLVGAIYPLPKIALISLLILWLGLGNPPIIALIMTSVFFPMLVNTMAGIQNLDRTLIDAALDMGATRRQLMLKVILPGALPIIFGGIRVAAAVSLIVVVAVEMLIASTGIGYMINWAAQFYMMDLLFSGMVAISIFGIIVFKIIDVVEGWLVPYRQEGGAMGF